MIGFGSLPAKIEIHGIDYYVLTGYESTENKCWWCGKEIENNKHHAHYCRQKSHGEFIGCFRQYHRHFDWNYASDWALNRSGRKCQLCGQPEKLIDFGFMNKRTNLEVHHIVPLKGSIRQYNIYNIPCNLIVLCHDCHWDIHASKAKRIKKSQSVMQLEIPKEETKTEAIL